MSSLSAPPKSKPALRTTQVDAGNVESQSSESDLPKREKYFSTALSRSIFISALLVASVYLTTSFIVDRYTLASVPNSANIVVFKLDRLTGTLQFCTSLECQKIRE